ncbi:MAG: low molecular weight phosphotyrosine protein phosphatase [Acidiferrobacterales bacterium]|nr:low molecular weight phosphotyrosine protein phosphatase [Acidiferrobacterales bacterium]
MNSEQVINNNPYISNFNQPVAMEQSAEPKKVLFVCYGNICRSPSAQGIFDFLAAIDKKSMAFESDSAGTHDFHIGKAPDPRAIRALGDAGLDISGLKCRQLGVSDFREFDHIIVMDQRNLEFVSKVCPAQYMGKVTMITEYSPDSELNVIPDPFHGTDADFDVMVNQLFVVCKSLVESLSADMQTRENNGDGE